MDRQGEEEGVSSVMRTIRLTLAYGSDKSQFDFLPQLRYVQALFPPTFTSDTIWLDEKGTTEKKISPRFF